MSATREAPPRAGAMLEALRGLGYSTAGAIADIVDNSISAGARNVDMSCPPFFVFQEPMVSIET